MTAEQGNRDDDAPRLRPIILVLACQLTAAALCFGLAWTLPRAGMGPFPAPLIAAAMGLTAALLGLRWGLAMWWAPVQLVVPGAVLASLLLALPAWIYLAVFVVLLLVFWNAGSERVPLYLTNRKTWAALAALLPEGDGGRFADLGSGLGGTLADLSRRRPDMRFDGVESAPIPYVLGLLRLRFLGRANAHVTYGDMWALPLGEYDVVYAFLSPAPMARLYDKVKAEMKPGSVFISNSFRVPGADPDDIVTVEDGRKTELLIWRR